MNTITEQTRVSFEIGKIWAVVGAGIAICITILTAYYDFKSDFKILQQKTELELKVINMRLDKLENNSK